MTVWKFPVQAKQEWVVEMPEGAQVLSVVNVAGTPYIYAAVNPDNAKRSRKFYTVPTGVPAPEKAIKFLGSFTAGEGHNPIGIDGMPVAAFVFHVFEATE